MPVLPSGQLRSYTDAEILAMNIRTAGVRDMSHGSETREVGQSTMEKSFWVRWASRFDFCALCCGDQALWVDSGVTKLSRMLPDLVYGEHPNFPEIVATKIESIRGANGPGMDFDGAVEYVDALVTVHYEHVPYELRTDTDIATAGGSEFLRYAFFGKASGRVDAISIPGGAMRYWRDPALPSPTDPPNGQPVPYGVTVSKAEEEFSYNWVQLPYEAFEPTSNLYGRIYGTNEGDLAYLGCVNSAVVFDRPVGTVIFSSVTPTLQRSHTGAGRRWSLEYNFAYSSRGWNWLYYPDPTGTNADWFNVNNTAFQTADVLGDGNSLAPGARDLNDLFSVRA